MILIGAHAATHDNEEVIVAPIGQRLAKVETNTIDLDPAVKQHITINAHGIRMKVFKRQCPHVVYPVTCRFRTVRSLRYNDVQTKSQRSAIHGCDACHRR
jgi:hypothetical protein